MTKRAVILFVLLILSTSNFLFSQTPPFHHYNTINGLPSEVVNDILQDKMGYIWLATNNGVCVFNGKSFRNYTIRDGLYSNNITSLAEGDNGEIYVCTYENGINYIKDRKVFDYIQYENRVKLTNIFYYKKNLIGYNTYGRILLLLRDRFLYLKVNDDYQRLPVKFNKEIIRTEKNIFFAIFQLGIFESKGDELFKQEINGINESELNCISVDKNDVRHIGSKGKIYVIKNDSLMNTIYTEKPDQEVNKIFYDSNGNLWYSIMNEGLRLIKKNKKDHYDISDKLNIPKAFINKFFQDRDGNVWFITNGKGVYCIYNNFIENFNEDDGLCNNTVNAIEFTDDNKLLIGTLNGVSLFDHKKFYNLKLKENLAIDYIYQINKNENDFYLSSSMYMISKISKSFHNLNLVYYQCASYLKMNNHCYILGGWGNYFNIINDSVKENKRFFIQNVQRENRINAMIEDQYNNIWVASHNGLYKCENENYEKIEPVSGFNYPVNFISIRDNDIWVAGEKGISKINLLNNETTNLYDEDFYYSKSFIFDNKNRLWFATSNGLFLYEPTVNYKFNIQNGLPSNDIITLKFDSLNNILWIGSRGGISSIDINQFDSQLRSKTKINIEYIINGDSIFYDVNDIGKTELEYNSVQVGMNVLNYTTPSLIKYQYKLDKDWVDANSELLQFNSLNGGKYNLFVRAKTGNSEWGEPVSVTLNIKPGFTETIYFQLLLFVFLSGLVLFIARFRINLHKRKNIEQLEITKRMDELKFQALSAMMNPHFVFNSLNSIQYLINIDKKKEANDYVAMMAKLIRKNLDTAQSSFIYLEEEISRLRLYLDIEKLRFGDKFSYEIETGSDVDVNSIMIPNMIIQPFVENSIWHGIMKAGNKGKISVSFTFENLDIDGMIAKTLLIKVTDNGVGLKEGLKHRPENDHVSKGIKIIEDRLRLLSKEIHLPQPLYIEDLSERNGEFHGTEVTIYLPPELYRV